MNSQSDRLCSAENVPLHDVKDGVWCAMSATMYKMKYQNISFTSIIITDNNTLDVTSHTN